MISRMRCFCVGLPISSVQSKVRSSSRSISGCVHPDQPPARQMLAQQHAEHRRLRRVFRRFIRQVDARMIGRGREQQFSAAGRRRAWTGSACRAAAAGPCPRGSRVRLLSSSRRTAVRNKASKGMGFLHRCKKQFVQPLHPARPDTGRQTGIPGPWPWHTARAWRFWGSDGRARCGRACSRSAPARSEAAASGRRAPGLRGRADLAPPSRGADFRWLAFPAVHSQLRTSSSNTASPQCASPSTLIWLISRGDIVR